MRQRYISQEIYIIYSFTDLTLFDKSASTVERISQQCLRWKLCYSLETYEAGIEF